MNTTIQSNVTTIREEKGKSLIDLIDDYCVIDIETTGFDPKYDEIIEISALKVRNNQIVDSLNYLIQSKNDIPEFISNLTGITDNMLKSGITLSYALNDFLNFIRNDILIGHNINFDINFLYDNCKKDLSKTLSNNFVDTLRLSRRINSSLKHHSLNNLIELYGINKDGLHRATTDCEVTKEVYDHLKIEILKQYNTIDNFKNEFQKKNYSIKAKDITSNVNFFNEDHILFNKTCVFTGTLEKMTRKEAMQIVVNYGGICGDTVTKETNYLILGNNDYCKTIKDGKSNKQKKAESFKLKGQDIEILSENVFYDMINDI